MGSQPTDHFYSCNNLEKDVWWVKGKRVNFPGKKGEENLVWMNKIIFDPVGFFRWIRIKERETLLHMIFNAL